MGLHHLAEGRQDGDGAARRRVLAWLAFPFVDWMDPPDLELSWAFALGQAPIDQMGHWSGQDLHSLRHDVIYPLRFRVVEAFDRLCGLLRVRKLEEEFLEVRDVTSGREVVVGGFLPDVVVFLRDVSDLLRDLAGMCIRVLNLYHTPCIYYNRL
jgi:hypothetical protein